MKKLTNMQVENAISNPAFIQMTKFRTNIVQLFFPKVVNLALEQMTKHPLTDQGIAKFQADYKAVFGE